MSFTVSDIINDAITLINDPTMSVASPAVGNFWTANEFYLYLKEGYRLLASSTHYWKDSKYVSFNLGDESCQAAYAYPADVLDVSGVFIPGVGSLEYTNPSDLDRFNANWDNSDTSEMEKGAPQWFYQTSLDGTPFVGFYPAADATFVAQHPTFVLRCSIIPSIPATISSSTAIKIPDQYAAALTYYILFRAYLKDGELQALERAKQYEDLFKAYSDKMKSEASGSFVSADTGVQARYL